MEIEKLLEAGWAVLYRRKGRRGRLELTALTKMPDWPGRNWAERTAYQAAYGFDEAGMLLIRPRTLRHPDVRKAVENSQTLENEGCRPVAIPGKPLPGSESRLRRILQGESRARETRSGRTLWIGPDGSIIHTSDEGWGTMPGQEPRETFPWEKASTRRQPWWAKKEKLEEAGK